MTQDKKWLAQIAAELKTELSTSTDQRACKSFKLKLISTPMGKMVSLTDEKYLYLLEFIDKKNLSKEIAKVLQKRATKVTVGDNAINNQLQKQLQEYFLGKRDCFSLPLFKDGTPFQEQVWSLLEEIPAGQTWSYQKIARKLGNVKLVRAVGNATGANKIALVIPCHRVIKTNGDLGGYAGGVERKQSLLKLEKNNIKG
ncbi:methylated-DNA--[protein]-cysteine S-methyltransferase [Liquorilactobacillus capillatus]|uniref:methylated-DNA--[protein]-cysteine S-methyltransferase n=1 Tax=Liquorilactobacillus capillatus DSM 19910 TaxID=1423731 RepID=A0A0R1MAR8_9LACO|nr:methylated-DNA--[protein]-cysteine S-methyltransferase [Liquorilactobacillus capillatus]KRL02178.1 methylated-DNA--protein-cysteine methyltransferase [Liquorilactobacillus capillatus DSM 19910]